MKNQKTLIIVVLFVNAFFVADLNAQKFYLSFNGGYALPMGSQELGTLDFYHSSVKDSSVELEQIIMSFGKGVNFEGTLGYRLNQFMGFEVGFSYLISDKETANKNSQITLGDQLDSVRFNSNSDIDLISYSLRITPSLIISSNYGKAKPYARFGLMFGKGSVELRENAVLIPEGSSIAAISHSNIFELKNGWAQGMTAGLGIVYDLGNKMSVFSEIRMISMSYAPKKGEITEYMVGSYDHLPFMNIYERETEFVDKYTYYSNDISKYSSPSKALKIRLPFSSAGLNIGLRVEL